MERVFPGLRLILLAGLLTAVHARPARADPARATWPQWGGPNRDFQLAGNHLAEQWPAEGPRRLWSRPLGEGYSSIAANAGKLYTVYRDGDDEIAIALQADTGDTLWEHRCRAVPDPEQTAAYGQGPNATPLILGDRIITAGFTGFVHCLDVESGKPLWSHDLVRDFGGRVQFYGYSGSPIAYKDTVLVLVGGEDCGVVALDPTNGKPVWKSAGCEISHAAPVLINVDGQDQLVFFSPTEVIGMDPGSGSFLWRHPVVNFCKTNCTSAIWGDDNLLWVATKGVGGTRVLRLSQRDGKTEVEQVWFDRKIRVYHWNAIRLGDHVYTSIGDSRKFLSVIDIKTGDVLDRQPGFGSTNSIHVDGRILLLDDSGQLALAEVAPGKITIRARAQLFESVAWTPPTLVGQTLYVRNRRDIMAFDLGDSSAARLARAETPLTAPKAAEPATREPARSAPDPDPTAARALAPPIQASPSVGPTEADALPDAATVIDRFIEVTGGKEAYGKIRNRVTKARVVHVGMDFEDRLVAYEARPNLRCSIVDSEAFGPARSGTDGKTVWFLSENTGPVIEQGEARDAALDAAALDRVVQWRAYYREAKCTGEETIAGNACHRIVLTPNVGEPETRYYDKYSGLLVKTMTNRLCSVGMLPSVPIEILLEDYRPVDGLLLPHKVTQATNVCGSRSEMVFIAESIRHNLELAADRFDVPAEVEALVTGKVMPKARCGPASCAPVKGESVGTGDPPR